MALAAAVGLVAQTPNPSGERVRNAVVGCPTDVRDLLSMVGSRTTTTVATCDGRHGQDVEAHVLVRDAAPGLGEPCEDLRFYPVTFVETPGGWNASFAFADGATRGGLPLPADDWRMIESNDAYVADVQLGSFEPRTAGDHKTALLCRIDPTYHFYCPTSRALDQLCVTWVRRSARRSS